MIEFRKGEGTLRVQVCKDGIRVTYICIDDYATKELNTDDLMRLLGYKIN